MALSYLFKINSGKLCVSNSTFNDNSCCIYKGHDAEFTNCTFTNNVNRADRITFNIDSDKANVVFTDCDTGTSVFSNEKYVKFVDSSLTAEDTAGSFFGEGSIAMIVSLVSLAISVCVAIAFYKTKATPASGATADEE